MNMHKHLFLPGPVEVRQDILDQMATPMISHRGRDASELQKRISDKLRAMMKTKSEIVLSTSSGSGLMEGAIRSCTRKRAVVFSIGAFGDRWHQIAQSNNVPSDLISYEMGQAVDPEQVRETLSTGRYDVVAITHNETSTGITNPLEELSSVIKDFPDVIWLVDAVSSFGGCPIDVDRLKIDVLITSSQKCLGLPPGLSLCSVSEQALRAAEQVPFRGSYFDLVALCEYIRKKNYQYPSTPSLSHMFALDYQLDRIFDEGLESRYQRHLDLAVRTRNWAREAFSLFGDERYLSPTVTCVLNTREISVAELNKYLGDNGYQISNGYGAIKEKTFRIAHMADTTMDELDQLLRYIDRFLEKM